MALLFVSPSPYPLAIASHHIVPIFAAHKSRAPFLPNVPAFLSIGRLCRSPMLVKATPDRSNIIKTGDWGQPISLGTAKLPADVDLQKVANYLYQWGNNLTQNANLPLPTAIKVDKIDGGVRLGYVTVIDGVLEDLVHIDCLVFPSTADSKAMFRALRNGKLKNTSPPGEAVIMQSLLQALRKSIELSKN